MDSLDLKAVLTLWGSIDKIDASFSHEFGVEKVKDLELTSFQITVFVGFNEIDITKTVKENHPDLYQEYLMKFLKEKSVEAG